MPNTISWQQRKILEIICNVYAYGQDVASCCPTNNVTKKLYGTSLYVRSGMYFVNKKLKAFSSVEIQNERWLLLTA
jgi:hypothetical protein